MPYFLSPVIGDGTPANLYRPKLDTFIGTWTAYILSGKDGRPRISTCIVWVPDNISIPAMSPDITLLDYSMARATILQADNVDLRFAELPVGSLKPTGIIR